MTALTLGTLGLTLSLLVPEWLARARWTARAPRAAVVLWQAVALASVLSALGVVLAGPEELVRASRSGPLAAVEMLAFALLVAGVIVVRLTVALVLVLRRSRARRERHRLLVDLLDRRDSVPLGLSLGLSLSAPLGSTGLRVLDGPVAFAYCVPGRQPRVVLSQAALAELSPAEVAAVVTHEQAHLRARHDLVLEAFTALNEAVPRPLRSRTSLMAVHVLLEMLADDGARRRHGDAVVRSALARLADRLDDDAAPEHERARRLARLAPGAPGTSRVVEVAAYLAAVAVVVLPTVVVVVPWLRQALATLPWPAVLP